MLSSKKKFNRARETLNDESMFKPSIKIFTNNNKQSRIQFINIHKDRVDARKNGMIRFYDESKATPRNIHPPASKENEFINQQKYLLPHERTRTPTFKTHRDKSTERVF
jgi:hypothetical protein